MAKTIGVVCTIIFTACVVVIVFMLVLSTDSNKRDMSGYNQAYPNSVKVINIEGDTVTIIRDAGWVVIKLDKYERLYKANKNKQ
jgi:hypothetical protein